MNVTSTSASSNSNSKITSKPISPGKLKSEQSQSKTNSPATNQNRPNRTGPSPIRPTSSGQEGKSTTTTVSKQHNGVAATHKKPKTEAPVPQKKKRVIESDSD